MLTIYFKGKKYGPIPDKYNELSSRQLIAMAALLTSAETEAVASLKALRILLDMGLWRFLMLKTDIKDRMLSCIDWVFEKNSVTKQLLPHYDGLYGPADEFDNLTMGEWNASEIFYAQWLEDKDEDALNKLIAVLYRKPKKNYNFLLNTDGDVREKFNPNEIDYWKQMIATWKPAVKKAILFYYDGCREDLVERYDLFDGSESKTKTDPGMFEVIRGLCGERYGGIKEVEEMNVHLALRELELMKKEAREIEQNQPK